MTSSIPMVKDSVALALGAWQGTVSQDFHHRAYKDVPADVPGCAVGDCFVLIRPDPWPPLRPKYHIIPTIWSAFKVYLVLAA